MAEIMQERLPKTYCPIKNSIAEALARHRLSSYESSVLWVVIRKTYGWTTKDGTRKTEDRISLSQLSEATGIPTSHVSRTVKLLILRRIITQRGKFLGVNKHTEEWTEAGRKDLRRANLPNGVTEVTQRGKFLLPNGVSTKENKEIYTKEIKQGHKPAAPVEKPVDNPEVKKAMDQLISEGFNIYAMLFKAKSQMKQPKDFWFPDAVILAVCAAYRREKEQIRNPWTWFLSVLQRESAAWVANQNIQEHAVIKGQGAPELIKEIMRKTAEK